MIQFFRSTTTTRAHISNNNSNKKNRAMLKHLVVKPLLQLTPQKKDGKSYLVIVSEQEHNLRLFSFRHAPNYVLGVFCS